MRNNARKTSYFRFLMIYLQRWQLTNIPYLVKNIISSAVVFFLTCYAVKSDAFELMEPTKSCLFAVLMCTIWSGLFNSIAIFYNEADYTMDDLTKVLPVRVYLAANVLIQGVLCLAEAVISVTIFNAFFHYSATGLVTALMNFDYIITFFLVLFSADMLGFAVGVLVNNITTAMTLIPLVLIAQFLFSGCLFELDGALKFVSQFTSARWGYSALGSLADLNEMSSRFTAVLPTYTPDPSDLFEATSSFVQNCWIHLGILSIVAAAIASLLLFWKMYKA